VVNSKALSFTAQQANNQLLLATAVSLDIIVPLRRLLSQKSVPEDITAPQDLQNPFFVHLDTTVLVVLVKHSPVLQDTTALVQVILIRNVLLVPTVHQLKLSLFGAQQVLMDLAT